MRRFFHRKFVRWTLIALGLLLLVALAGGLWWVGHPAYPAERANASLVSDSSVAVIQGDNIVFQPVKSNPTIGIIFYPGGLVESGAYSQISHGLATLGYLVIIPRMPLDLAVLAPDTADKVIAAYPKITNWVLAGHSLGASMAARYAEHHPDVKGLIMLAGYPEAGIDLSDNQQLVLSIYGSEDKLAGTKASNSLGVLPSQTQLVMLAGGNHAGFGDYGKQNGDGDATISNQEQQSRTIALIKEFLQKLNN